MWDSIETGSYGSLLDRAGREGEGGGREEGGREGEREREREEKERGEGSVIVLILTDGLSIVFSVCGIS